MNKKGRSVFFIVAVLIFALAYTAFFGVSKQYGDIETTVIKGAGDIRFGIDIRGGVDVTITPAGGYDATDEQLNAAEEVIKLRLVNLNITDYEIYADHSKDRIILRFPWKEGETNFNPEEAIQEIGATAHLTFREGRSTDGEGKPSGVTAETVILDGADVKNATAIVMEQTDGSNKFGVRLELADSGKEKFAEATSRLVGTGYISIWMDDTMISAPSVDAAITDGVATISGSFTSQEATALANQINSGALPFALSAENFSTISPTLGSNALEVMVQAGVIAFALVCLFIILKYRLPGVVASIALLGQTAATIAAISGYFSVLNSFTLTLPGIAGIILSIGMGVDANIITAERIREEVRSGKTLDGAISAGFSRGLTPIIDGNITVIIVAVILMGAFGPTDGFFAKMLKPIFFAFGPSTAGTIYSFGFTLLVGVLLNFVMGVVASRLMIRSLSKLPALRSPWLYGGAKAGAEAQHKEKKNFSFMANRKKFFATSSLLIVAVVVFSAVFGVKMDIQFTGGAMLTYSYQGDVEESAVQNTVQEVLGGSCAVQYGSPIGSDEKTVTISLPGTQTVSTEELASLLDAFDASFGDNHFTQLEVNNVNPTIGREFFAKSIVAVVAASLLILAYIAYRFRKIGGLPAGSMAVVALIHDLIIIFGVYSFLRIPLNGNFIAALLTILGYSINDTVVIYDRIRENRKLYGKKMPFAQLVDLSINQSLVRSINTTVSTVIALGTVCVVAYLNGLSSIYTFALPLIFGMISGVYSTVCLAGPLWVSWEEHRAKNAKGSKKKKTA